MVDDAAPHGEAAPGVRAGRDQEPVDGGEVPGAHDALKRRPPVIAEDARAALEGYSWPGNVRELRNVVERAVVMSQSGDLRAEHLMLADDGETRDAAATIPPSISGPLAAAIEQGSPGLAPGSVPNFDMTTA